MACCNSLFAAECLGPAATMLSRWDLESSGLFGVEYGLLVWWDGIDAIPAVRLGCCRCRSSERGAVRVKGCAARWRPTGIAKGARPAGGRG